MLTGRFEGKKESDSGRGKRREQDGFSRNKRKILLDGTKSHEYNVTGIFFT